MRFSSNNCCSWGCHDWKRDCRQLELRIFQYLYWLNKHQHTYCTKKDSKQNIKSLCLLVVCRQRYLLLPWLILHFFFITAALVAGTRHAALFPRPRGVVFDCSLCQTFRNLVLLWHGVFEQASTWSSTTQSSPRRRTIYAPPSHCFYLVMLFLGS
jgi:hypothetical protein